MRTLYTGFRWAYDGEPQEMLVEEGIVVARERERKIPQEADEIQDLKGAYLAPSFIDSHCHILPTGLDLRKLHLGPAESHSDVLDLVRESHKANPEGWLLAVHYDQTKYEGGKHLTLSDLDAVSLDRPILLRHSNGHASVANSAALAAANVNQTTPDPNGGSFGRDEFGKLTGALFEHAHEMVSNAAPPPDLEQMVEAILLAGDEMSAVGIACASDMMTGRFDLAQEIEAYRLAALKGCKVSTRLYLQWRPALGPKGFGPKGIEDVSAHLSHSTSGRSKIAGIKIFADGAIGSATAAIYGTYTGEPATGPRISRAGVHLSTSDEVSGQLIYPPDRLNQMVRVATDAGHQVAVHAIGDYAADLVMDAFELSGEPQKHRVEHAMILSDAQIERMAKLDCFVAFQPEFLLRFGQSYRRQLGPERAAKLKRIRSVIDAGLRVSFSSDRPIVAGNPWDGIRTAFIRPEGFDRAENCTLEEAFNAYTRAGSEVNGDGAGMGTLEPGAAADFQLLSESIGDQFKAGIEQEQSAARD